MIIVDKALEQRQASNNPIRVGMVGAGFMGRGIALQIINVVPGMELVAISNRHMDGARSAYQQAGANRIHEVETLGQIEQNIAKGNLSITEDASLLAQAENIDVILEVTGSLEYAVGIVLEAIKHRKHIVSMNAELDGTVGPILREYADREGVIYTNVDGDQPGVIMNLYRFVKGIGVKPVLCGNIKGLQDPYRNPTTQEGFAKKWGQKAHMVTSFADGTKISFEQAIVANATGMRVAKRGMYGPTVPYGTPIEEAVDWYPLDELVNGPGIVDYVVGAVPGGGVFVLGAHDHPQQQHYLKLYKVGEGPLYCFYNPYHLPHFEAHNTIARAALFQEAAVEPISPCVDVIAVAKTDLKTGQTLDGIGYYMTYGQCENSQIVNEQGLLPMGIAEGCELLKDISKDQPLTYEDIRFPESRLIDKLRHEQFQHFSQGNIT